MPKLDKTGPQGQGPMTGRKLGPCGGGRGMGFSRCRGYGKGLGRYFGWNAPQTSEEKLEDAEIYKKALMEEMAEVDKEIIALQAQE